MDPKQIVHSDPEIVSGTPVFVGTRVPAQALLDYLEGGGDPRRVSRRLSECLSRTSDCLSGRGWARALLASIAWGVFFSTRTCPV